MNDFLLFLVLGGGIALLLSLLLTFLGGKPGYRLRSSGPSWAILGIFGLSFLLAFIPGWGSWGAWGDWLMGEFFPFVVLVLILAGIVRSMKYLRSWQWRFAHLLTVWGAGFGWVWLSAGAARHVLHL